MQRDVNDCLLSILREKGHLVIEEYHGKNILTSFVLIKTCDNTNVVTLPDGTITLHIDQLSITINPISFDYKCIITNELKMELKIRCENKKVILKKERRLF